jgi:sporulation protein YlmC with PRC-barrel domain
MYSFASKLHGLPIISLQTGETAAWVKRPIFDITTLEVTAFLCESNGGKQTLVLTSHDVRQFATDCLIIDNEDELTEPGDIIRLAPMIEAAYTPLDKVVVSDTGRKLGRVEDYTINLDTTRLQKLFIRQSLFQSWLGSSLTIDRSQIIDVTPKRIVVRDSTLKAPIIHPEPMPEGHP